MEKGVLKEWVEKNSRIVVEPSSPAIADQLLRPLPDGFPPPKLDHYICLIPSRALLHLERGSNYPDAGEIYQHLPMDNETKAFLRKRRNVAEVDLDDCAALLRLGDALNDPKGKDPVILLVIKKCLTSTALYGPLSATDVENWKAVECKTLRAKGLSYKIYSALLFDINIGDTIRLHPNIRDDRDYMEGAEEYEPPVQYGILRYKTAIFKLESTAFWANNSDREEDDTWLGVELSGKFAGRGDSDGTFKGKRYFRCRDKCARFVAFWDVDYSPPEPETWCRCKLVDPLDRIVSRVIKERSIANPKNPLTIEEVENVLNRAFPYPLSCIVELVVVPADLISQYGGRKHQQEVEKLRKLSGVFDVMCSEHEGAKYFIVTADSKMYRVGRDSLEVAREVFKYPSPLARDAFSKPNCESLKTVQEVSGCVVRLSQDKVGLQLTGLKNDIRAARLLLDDEVTSLQSAMTKTNAKGKSKKKNRKAAAAAVEMKNVTERLNTISLPPDQRGVDCVVCLALPSNTAFHPCGHKQTCQNCAQKLFQSDNPNCPTCRAGIKLLLRIFE